MAPKFEDLINDMVNIGFGVAATAAEKGKEVLDDLSAKGADARDQVVRNTLAPDARADEARGPSLRLIADHQVNGGVEAW